MPRAKLPRNEVDRLAALRRCEILDTSPDDDFDALTALAAEVCEVPVALVSLVDHERQWFKSTVGLCITETPRDQAFCAHALHSDEPLIIPDATKDDRTSDNLLVTGQPRIRFYAGAPLLDSNGFALGTLCVIDYKPRELNGRQIKTLKQLARQVVARIELRREVRANQRLRSAVAGTRHGISWGTVLSLVIGLAITAGVVRFTTSAQSESTAQHFARLHEGVLGEISRRINLPGYGLKGARGVYAASGYVERDEFAAYVASRDLPREFPGVMGMGFIKHVARDRLDPFIAAERADHAPAFSIHSIATPTTPADDLYVVKYFNATESGQAGWGLDIGSDPDCRAAAERAVATGDNAITAPISLAPVGSDRRGFLYIVPVYKNKTHPLTPEARQAALDGLLFASVAVDKVFAGVTASSDGMLELEVTDNDTAAESATLYHSTTDHSPPTTGTQSKTSSVPIGGRVWTIRTTTTPKFAAATFPVMSIVAGVCGTLLSGLLAATVWSMGRSRARAFALAQNMTADLSDAKNRAERTAAEIRKQSSLLRIQGERLARTNHLAHVGGWELDLQTKELTWTDEVYRIHELAVGTTITLEQAISFYETGSQAVIRSAVENAIATGNPWDLELQLITATGRPIWIRTQGECLKQEDAIHKLCGAFQDITDRKLAEIQLRSSATCDKLTGLPNRASLTDRLHLCQTRYARDPARPFAVLFLDFDRFKHTNDTLGHDAGDDLLRQIAARLRDALGIGATDALTDTRFTVGRLGGDEFVVILDAIDGLPDATAGADRLLRALAEPYRIFGHRVVSTASIGIVTSSPDCTRPDELLRNADIAMYEAKLAGKGCYVVFDAAMQHRAQKRVQTEADLRDALQRGELSLAYQPMLALDSRNTHGAEALLRWNHPTRGMIPAAEWIPVAEETGLILTIGDWVLRQACEQFMAWRTALGDRAPLSVSVNMSRKQLMVENLADRLRALLDDVGMPPECLQLEVRESVVMKDPAAVKAVLWDLRKIGVRIGMDGFGLGHSSLSMLHEFPINVLKIDGSFITNLGNGREFIAVVQAIAQLAHNLGMTVVAEGIETPDQLIMLQTINCELGQGNLLGLPMDSETFVELIQAEPVHEDAVADDRCEAA